MSFFKKKKGKTTTQVTMTTPEQDQAREMLSRFSQTGQAGNYQAGEEYGGELGDFNMSDAEQAGQSRLMEMINSAMPQGFTNAQNEFQSVLDGQYDPNKKGGIYEGFQKNVNRNAQDQQDSLQRSLSLTGDMYSSDRSKQLGILGERTNDTLTNKLAELYDQYAQRRLGAAGELGRMGVQEEGIKTNRINLANTVGSLQRTLKDSQAKAKYAEWGRARGEQQSQIDVAKTLFQKDVPYGVKSITAPDRPSTFMSILGEASPAIGSYNTHQYGYSTNQNSISNAMEGMAAMAGMGAGGGAGAKTGAGAGAGAGGSGGIMNILKLLGLGI